MAIRYAWVDALEVAAPNAVAAWRGIEQGEVSEVQRSVRARSGPGTAERSAAELGGLAAAMSEIVASLGEETLRAPGGEADRTVAETIGHVADARAGLCLAAAKAVTGSWPTDAPRVVPSVPGSPDADRPSLVRRIDRSQRIVRRCAGTVAGHETDPCPLQHPLVGRLLCGEWLVFAGVHDLMHLEQLHDLIEGAA